MDHKIGLELQKEKKIRLYIVNFVSRRAFFGVADLLAKDSHGGTAVGPHKLELGICWGLGAGICGATCVQRTVSGN